MVDLREERRQAADDHVLCRLRLGGSGQPLLKLVVELLLLLRVVLLVLRARARGRGEGAAIGEGEAGERGRRAACAPMHRGRVTQNMSVARVPA